MNPIVKYIGQYKYVIVPKFTYEISGEVLVTDSYWSGPMAEISPYDISVGWGYLTHPAVQKHLVYDHGNRFYTWQFSSDAPRKIKKGRAYIISHSSNNHVIPHDETIDHALSSADNGDKIRLKGYLVNVHKFDKETGNRAAKPWKTSVIRRDHGASGCEIIYVTALQVNKRLYESDFNPNEYHSDEIQ